MAQAPKFSVSRLGIDAINRTDRLLHRLGLAQRPLSAAGLMRAACEHTGLDDFGGDEFVEPLERLLAACATEARLTFVGRTVLRHDVLSTLVNRLHLVADRKADPEIARQRIVAPIFIISLPRTGTTLLHALLAADPDNRVPLTWETMYPSARSRHGTEAGARRRRAAADLRWMERLAPGFAAMHLLDPDLPQECLVLMAPAFQSYQYQTMYDIPSYVTWLREVPLDHGYRMHRRFLQHLQRTRPARRWVLKAPAHMAAMDALLDIYPDARIIQIHRDPRAVLASDASLTATLFSAFSDQVDRRAVGRETLERLASWLDRFMTVRRTLPREQVCDLRYDELVADPLAAVRRIYRHFGLEPGEKAIAGMRDMLARHPRHKHGRHRYRAEDFGLDHIDREPVFRRYRETFGLG